MAEEPHPPIYGPSRANLNSHQHSLNSVASGATATDQTQSAASRFMNLPPHVHAIMARASIQLLPHQQQALDCPMRNGVYTYNGSDFSLVYPQRESTNTAGPEQAVPDARPTHRFSEKFKRITHLAESQGQGPRDAFLEYYKWVMRCPTKNLAPRTTPAGPGYSYSHAPKTRFGDQQSDPQRRVQLQINYLDCLAASIPPFLSFQDEMHAKEKFRAQLTKVAREAVEQYANERGYAVGPKAIDLKCFGGLRNGFALPGTDLDLVMSTRASDLPTELVAECPRILEKAFLDAGYGARLISKTRIPIIKLCESPSLQALDRLKAECDSPNLKDSQETGNDSSPRSLDDPTWAGRTSPQPGSDYPRRRPNNLDCFESNSGIQCDINFSGALALYNTDLLRAYALGDQRIRTMGAFVKMWAKARKINSPYGGTLCSYAYILMVLHYVMNVVHPPLVPNLQIIQEESGYPVSDTVNGCDVRFLHDDPTMNEVSAFNTQLGNCQSVGELLRGFFAYYGSRGLGAPRGGFDWVRSTISIRTPGGIRTKLEKGWNTAKTDMNGNRLRFLIAIEDPFEHGHNVGRTVTSRGIHRIRDEFDRAQKIINRIQEIPGVGWEWRTFEGEVGSGLLAEAGDVPVVLPPRGHHEVPRAAQNSPAPHSSDVTGPSGSPSEPVVGDNTKAGDPASTPLPLRSISVAQDSSHPLPSADLRKRRSSHSKIRPNNLTLIAAPRSTPGASCSPLIRNPVAEEKARKSDYRSHIGTAAKTMERMLSMQSAHTPNALENEIAPVNQSVEHDDEPNKADVETEKEQTSMPATLPSGVILDARQFHGPSAIRDRQIIFQNHWVDNEDDDEVLTFDTEGHAVRNALDVPDTQLLATLPFYSGTQ